MPKTLDPVNIPASKRRLWAMAVFGLLACGGSLLNLSPVVMSGAPMTWLGGVFLLFAAVFLAWTVAAFWVIRQQPALAYRLRPEGLYVGDQGEPAFAWDQVSGATVVRGKRRSSLIVVLDETEALNPAGLLPSWLAMFLGRPTDADLALTNMDTALDLKTFLDLIGPYFHTYGPVGIKET